MESSKKGCMISHCLSSSAREKFRGAFQKGEKDVLSSRGKKAGGHRKKALQSSVPARKAQPFTGIRGVFVRGAKLCISRKSEWGGAEGDNQLLTLEMYKGPSILLGAAEKTFGPSGEEKSEKPKPRNSSTGHGGEPSTRWEKAYVLF